MGVEIVGLCRTSPRVPAGVCMRRLTPFAFCALFASAALGADVAVRETPAGSVKGTLIPSVVTSADARHVAYVARDVSKQLKLYLDGKALDVPVDAAAASGIAFSADGARMAAIVGAGSQWKLVTDGKEGKPYEGFVTGSLLFSPTGS